jgi:hypothetical protein
MVAWVVAGCVVAAGATLFVVRAHRPDRPDESAAVKAYIRVHDALVAASEQRDATLADLVVRWYRCADGGVTIRSIWATPTSTAGARSSDGRRARFDAVLRDLGATSDDAGNSSRVGEVRVGITDRPGREMQIDGAPGDRPKFNGTGPAVVALSAVTVDVRSACYDTDRPTPAHDAEALDPVATLAALRLGTPPSIEAFDTRQQPARRAAPLLPTVAVSLTGDLVDEVSWLMAYGVPSGLGAAAEPFRDEYIGSGSGRSVNARATVVAVDDVACGDGMQRLTATVPTILYTKQPATGKQLHDRWHALLETHINRPANTNDTLHRPLAVRQIPLPEGPPVIAGSATSNGGAVLRGDDRTPVLQVFSPCTRLASDPVLDANLRSALTRGAGVTALASLSSRFRNMLG